jgi:hypothetical protein
MQQLLVSGHIDFVGDIHGGYDILTRLLDKLGWQKQGKSYTHPDNRQLCFLGDIINIGNQNLKVIQLIRTLCDEGKAACICGNHEFALYRYWIKNPDFFTEKKLSSDMEIYLPFLKETGSRIRFTEIMLWFSQLPVVVINPLFVAVHAYWEESYEHLLKPVGDEDISAGIAEVILSEKENPLRLPVFNLIFGKRISLPHPLNPFITRQYRYAWWDTKPGDTYRDIVISRDKSDAPKVPVTKEYFTQDTTRPVFFGHYWLKNKPRLTHPIYCCLDFGGAKGGYLTAYRFDENTELSDKYLIF